jgi:hypothetical protein
VLDDTMLGRHGGPSVYGSHAPLFGMNVFVDSTFRAHVEMPRDSRVVNVIAVQVKISRVG